MAIRATLARLLGAKASILGLPADEIPDRPLEKSWDDASLLSTFGDDAWPYIVGNKVGEQASQAPLQICTRKIVDNRVELTPVDPDHPVQQLFDVPQPQMDGGEFTHLLLLYMGLTGHAPIEVVRPIAGRRGIARTRAGWELWLHNPGPWRIVANPDGTVRGYLYLSTRGSADVSWTPEQMTYLRWPNPTNRWYGQGHIQAIRQAVMAEEYAAIRDKKFEKNLGVPPGILSSEMPLGDPTAELLQKRWQQAVGGYQNAGKIAILGSKTTFQPIELSRKDNEWLATRLNRVEIIAGAWGMPLPLIRMQDATFSNVAGARSELWEGTLQPRLNRIARMVTLRLLPLITAERLVARYDYTAIEALAENDLQAAQTATEWAKTGAVIVDEVRGRLSLPPHPDAQVGRSQLVPTTIALSSFETITAPPPEPAPPAAPEPPTEPAKAHKAEPSIRETVLAPIRAEYARDLGRFFDTQRNAILNAWGKASPEDQAFLDELLALLGSHKFRERLRRISQGPIEQSVTLGATEAARSLAIEVSFAIPTNDAALARVTSHLDILGKGIENTTIADVSRVVTGALQSGATHAEIRAALGELFDGYADWRLDRIARTETAAAYNLGALGQYKAGGIELVTVVDGDADAVCAAWNGREHVPLAEAEGSPLGHPNAIMAGTRVEVLGSIEVGYRANWSGPLVSLVTAGGANLAIGPNHPVLTSRGWLAAKALREGDHVIRRARERFSAVDVHLDQPVARIERVFDALLAVGTNARITAAPTYFHGDGNYCEGEVEIVRPECPLLIDVVIPAPQLAGKVALVGTGPQSATLTSDGPSDLRSERVHLASARGVGSGDVGGVVGRLATLDAALAEPLSDGAIGNAEFAADFEARTSIAVELDEVIHVGRAEFTGHAFDLQTGSGAYFADDILVHNCTRSWVPEVGAKSLLRALPKDDVNEAQVRAIIREMVPGPPVFNLPAPVAPVVTVEASVVNVPPAVVNVASPEVTLSPSFTVPPIDMAPVAKAIADMGRQMAKAEPKRSRRQTVKRDEFGRIAEITEE